MKEKLLARAPIFTGLPDDEIKKLSETLQVIEVPPSTVIFQEGEIGDRFYIIIQGQIEVIKALGTPEERFIGVRGPGEFVGELSLINRAGLRTASVRSLGPAHLWEMSHTEFDALLHRQPRMAFELISVLSERLTNAHDSTIKDLQEKNIELTKAYEELKAAQAQIIEKERLERELQVAFEIQTSILPQKLPSLPGYDFGAVMIPARAVGGDFYDIIPLSADKVGIIIGDVADKGVPSAIFMAQTHALLYAMSTRRASPARVLQRVNDLLLKIGESSLFVTVLYGVLDRRTNLFSYARAGHELPIIIDPIGKAKISPYNQGQLMGILEGPILDEQKLEIPPGGKVFLYTDGVIDARHKNGDSFGMERLIKELQRLHEGTAQEHCEDLWQTLCDFQSKDAQEDDVTMVFIQSVDSFET
ncbi:MAG: SpoIIE family protein phosphatase [Chloroflexota bacterium]|nr:MAG: SpoIIE family protein phosphatase [Chloroflexota bacterium]